MVVVGRQNMTTEQSHRTIEHISSAYPPRIKTFRSEIIKNIPKIPNTRETVAHLTAMPTNKLMLIFLTWRMRFVPARRRDVKIWSGGVDPQVFASMLGNLNPLLANVTNGADLTPHLSNLVNTLGYSMPSTTLPAKRRDDKDGVLTKMGLHHFHVGEVSAKNPKARSGKLVFADVSDTEFRIIAISDHDAFDIGSEEWTRLFGISNRYIQSQLPAETVGFMAYPTMSSGHSTHLFLFARYCNDMMTKIDACLDDPVYINNIYNKGESHEGQVKAIPKKPKFKWHFNDNNFGIYETKNGVFFQLAICPR